MEFNSGFIGLNLPHYLLFVLFRCYLCCSMYCLCVNVYCHRVTTQVQLIYIISYIICSVLASGCTVQFCKLYKCKLQIFSICSINRDYQKSNQTCTHTKTKIAAVGCEL